jgi:hypothetical protein
MSLLEHQPEEPPEEEPSRTGRFILIGLTVIGCGVAAYYSMPIEDPAPVTTTAAPPPRLPAPTPAPAPDPDPVAPPAVRAAEPAPKPEAAAEPALSFTRLEPILRVASDVPGASVFLDRRYLGTTPFETTEVPPGRHRINVSLDGHDGFVTDIEIGDEPIVVDVRFLEIWLDTSVAVTHKHRFGSCEGVLHANLDGIHYETTDDDAFSIPLAEIELHEMNYLEHTLTLKRRAGRTYNFTDERDTADPLFVFHREVEQVRERLAASPGQAPPR